MTTPVARQRSSLVFARSIVSFARPLFCVHSTFSQYHHPSTDSVKYFYIFFHFFLFNNTLYAALDSINCVTHSLHGIAIAIVLRVPQGHSSSFLVVAQSWDSNLTKLQHPFPVSRRCVCYSLIGYTRTLSNSLYTRYTDGIYMYNIYVRRIYWKDQRAAHRTFITFARHAFDFPLPKLWYENTESYRNLLVQHQIETGNTRSNPIENAP